MRLTFTFILCIIVSVITAQTTTLVKDFNLGSGDGFNEHNCKAIYLGNDLIFPVVSGSEGEELGILKNGQLSLLKDINPGSEGSQPKDFVLLNDKIYFTAFDATNGVALWVTDGSNAGTKKLFDLASDVDDRPDGLIVSKSGFIYYTSESKLYRTDGDTNTQLAADVDFVTDWTNGTANYCLYNNEVAFVRIEDKSAMVYEAGKKGITLLGKTAQLGFFTKVYGLEQVEMGLVFCTKDSEATNEVTFLYSTTNKTVEKLLIDGTSPKLRRIVKYIDGKTCLAWIGNKGYYSINGENNKEVSLFKTSISSMTQGDLIDYAVYKTNVAFVARISNWAFIHPPVIAFSNGTEAGSKQLFELKSSHSNMIQASNYAFIATSIEMNNNPKFYYINLNDGTYINFYDSSESASSLNSIILLGVQNNKLYYISNLDYDKGRELYFIDLGDNISTNNNNAEKVCGSTVEIMENQFVVNSDVTEGLKVEVFNRSGQLLETIMTSTNIKYDISHLKGFVLLRFNYGNKVEVKKYLGL